MNSGWTTIKPGRHILIREFEDEQSHNEYQIIKSQIRTNMACDHNISVLIAYASLFSSDDCSEQLSNLEKRRIENIQENILLKLQRYIYATNTKSAALFHFRKTIETLIKLKEIPVIMLFPK